MRFLGIFIEDNWNSYYILKMYHNSSAMRFIKNLIFFLRIRLHRCIGVLSKPTISSIRHDSWYTHCDFVDIFYIVWEFSIFTFVVRYLKKNLAGNPKILEITTNLWEIFMNLWGCSHSKFWNGNVWIFHLKYLRKI